MDEKQETISDHRQPVRGKFAVVVQIQAFLRIGAGPLAGMDYSTIVFRKMFLDRVSSGFPLTTYAQYAFLREALSSLQKT